jgi:PAS domain S-box-containing protein
MSTGIISAGFIFYQSHGIDEDQFELQELMQKNSTNKNINILLSQWLSTLDLYLINKQTYLYRGIIHQAKIIENLANQINGAVELEQLKNKIKSVLDELQKCQKESFRDDEVLWMTIINRTDAITEDIDSPIRTLNESFGRLISLKKQNILAHRNFLNTSIYILFIGLAILTLLVLKWADRVIVKPIEKLRDVTKKENLKSTDFKMEGPREIRDLSSEFGACLATILKGKEEVLAESRLHAQANAQTRNIMETAGDAIVCIDIDGNFIEMNQSFRELSKIANHTSPKPSLFDFIPDLELTKFDDESSCILISFVEAVIHTANKQEIPIEISASSFGTSEKRLFTIIIRDISERKELLEQLLKAQKLESIGRLAAGIAHEINTPAQYIMDYNRFIKEGFEKLQGFIKAAHDLKHPTLEELSESKGLSFYEEEIPNAIKGSLFGLEQISKIVKSVKGFSHPQQEKQTLHSINNIIKDTVTVSKNEWKYDAEILMDLDENLPDVYCFPVRLNQVFLNLLVNAAQAIHQKNEENNGEYSKGTISISTKQQASNLLITIKDTGAGIPEDCKNKIFDPFFTTKDVGVGTGQGLAISYDLIVNEHKGNISVNSTPEEGTEFTILLPVKEETQQAS